MTAALTPADIWRWVLNFLTNSYCNTFNHVLCIVLYQPRSEKMKTFIQDLGGVIAIFGTLYAGLIIGHGIGL